MDFYGTDWDGPGPLHDDGNDDNTVLVDDLPHLISVTRQEALREQVPPLYPRITHRRMDDY